MMKSAIAKPTVIALHASGGSSAQWNALAESLQGDFRVLAPDLYGHGNVPAWLGAPSDILAADTARVASLAADAGGRVHLVGHSYGGAVALRTALHRPELVDSVVVYEPAALRLLFDHNAKARAAAEIAEVSLGIRHALNGGDLERAAQRFVDYWAGGERWAQLASAPRAAIARRMPVVSAHFISLIHAGVRLRDYAKIDRPVLYLAGRDTRVSARRITELLRYALPDVEVEMMSGMGHLGPITHTNVVADRIAAFVRRQAREPSASYRMVA